MSYVSLFNFIFLLYFANRYSPHTINTIIEELIALSSSSIVNIAFLSTPSLYFSLPEKFRQLCHVFDYDKKWDNDRGFVLYDYNCPSDIPQELHHTFDIIVIDPPFITTRVWEKYVETTLLCRRSEESKIILTTIIENQDFLKQRLNVTPSVFQPSIPNLVYQYSLYTNYTSEIFSVKNPEIPE